MSSFNLYWKHYGGLKSILKSSYFYSSIIFSFLVTFCGDVKKWYELPITILPNLLGFSIGAYAILLALGDNKFWEALAKEDNNNKETPFLIINSSFVHFILIQVIAITFALISKILLLDLKFFAFIGFFLLFYAIFTALASTFSILKLSEWYQLYLNKK